MEWHPFSKLFPMLGDDELQALAEDIRVNGLEVAILIDTKDRIIDGRNRAAACAIAGVEPVYEPFVGNDAAILKKVISLNVHRRHLNESQRAMVAAEVANVSHGSNRHKTKTENLEGQICTSTSEGVTVDEAAEALSVSPRSVKTARKVKEKGVEELQDAVIAGDIAVSRAAEIADKSPEEQREAVREVSRPKPPPAEPKPYDVMDDVIKLTALRDRLADNWTKTDDIAVIKQLFQRFAKEV